MKHHGFFRTGWPYRVIGDLTKVKLTVLGDSINVGDILRFNSAEYSGHEAMLTISFATMDCNNHPSIYVSDRDVEPDWSQYFEELEYR